MILWTRLGNLSYFRSLAVRVDPRQPSLPNRRQLRLLDAAACAKPFTGLAYRQHRQLKQPESQPARMSTTMPTNSGDQPKRPLSPSTLEALIADTTDKNFGFDERRPIDENGFNKFVEQMRRTRAQKAPSIRDFPFNEKRIRHVNGITAQSKGNYRGVCYWMFRDQRINDNWALIYAQKFALEHKCPLYVTFYLMSHYSVAGIRQYYFMLEGLKQIEKQCKKLGIQFHLELGYAMDHIGAYCEQHKIDFVIADMCPLRDPMTWVQESGNVLSRKGIPLYQIDAHNIVPVWVTSDGPEAAAYTIRPKINSKLREFQTEMPAIERHPHQPEMQAPPVDWETAWRHLKVDHSVKPVAWAKPGTINGIRMLYEFIEQRLATYDEIRNLPTRFGNSYLSPYFHFGQLSVQRAILAVSERSLAEKWRAHVDKFVEEAVVRRELADNFCYYVENYDNFKGAPDWAKQTIREHRKDKREHIYTLEEFQFAKTHDKLWNVAQNQMLQEGIMHNYLRVYWAKKIYEWSPSAEEALKIAFFLNDKYELDGRDPNGYTGIMWSIVGVQDRPFQDRPVYGKIRYMSYFAATRKFDCDWLAKTYNSK